MGILVQVALTEGLGGAVAGICADSVLYAIDSAKVRAQQKAAQGDWRILFRGMGPTILLGSVPVFGTFFLTYAPLKELILQPPRHNHHHHGREALNHRTTTPHTREEKNCNEATNNQLSPSVTQQQLWLSIAALVCAIPATVIGVPADVIKKRLVLGLDQTAWTAVRHVWQQQGSRGLFAGWHVNLIRDLPFAGIKIGLYESFVQTYQQSVGKATTDPISPTGAAMCGVASGVACAILTCPLDVVNTRIKAGSLSTNQLGPATWEILSQEGITALFRGVVLRSVVLGVGSCIFWPIQKSLAQHFQQSTTDCPVPPHVRDRLWNY